MITIRRAHDRGHADHGWLNSFHTFSFASYHDPEQMGFRSLRVLNEDRVAAGQGFGSHPHRDMEIISYVLEGELEHRDSLGHGAVLRPGEFQRITAGTGITHSEFNPSKTTDTHFYQIWLLPERKGLEPGYDQKQFDPALRENRLQLVASPNATEGSLLIHQDVKVYLMNLSDGHQVSFSISPDRHSWIQVLRGSAKVNGQLLNSGDAVATSDENLLLLTTDDRAELLLFDLN